MSESFLARLPLAANSIDRDYLTRDNEDALVALRGNADTRFIALHRGKALLASNTSLAYLDTEPPSELIVYLGRSVADGIAVFVAVVGDDHGLEGEWGDLRTLGGTLSRHDASVLTQALAITNWHASTAFSPVSGSATTPAKGGWVLLDEAGVEHFPRTDMAIIVAVIDSDDRILLGANAAWEPNRYSLLAGFVEPGESLEAAVAREVFEESGVRITDPRYLGSQPWPFPASLMLGFMARVDESQPSGFTPDGVEIVALRWFSRAELLAALPEIRLPSRASIARAIIEEWYGGPLEREPA
jgi:NAD+ diphosphatase